MRRRHPTPAERALWQESQRGTRPLKPEPAAAAPAPAPAAPAPAEAPPPPRARRSAAPPGTAPLPHSPSAPAKPPPAALTHGRMAGVDRRRADRLRRGQLPIEARLDLHGMTQAAAHARLSHFVAASAGEGRRCILVVTGIGRGESRGVLREAVPRWLNEPALRTHVLGFSYAQLKDGGMGALYVLLRRRREAR